jgi:hypothetical protein
MVATSLSKVNVSQDVEKKILTAIELKKELEKYETEIKGSPNDGYGASRSRHNQNRLFHSKLKSLGQPTLQKKFLKNFRKVVLDTSKVAKSVTLYGGVPDGIETKKTSS